MKAVVLGAGADARVAAAYLARGGVDVTIVGRASREAPVQHGWLSRHIAADLNLRGDSSLDLKASEGRASVADPQREPRRGIWVTTALADGMRLDFSVDIDATAEALREINPRDAAQWPRFCERMRALAAVLEDLYAAPPPDPLAHDAAGMIELARAALRVRKLGRRDMTELMRLAPMSAADLLDAWFESDAVKGVLGAQAVRHLAQGPRSGGTAFNFLHHHVGCAPGVFRQPLCDIDGALGALRFGEAIEADVARFEVRDGAVCAVVLDGGDVLAADVVVSALDLRHTLLELLDPGWLDPALVRAVRNVRRRGVSAVVEIALDAPPDFATLALAPSLAALERAYDDAKYGRMSEHPYVEAQYLGASEAGAHRVRAHAQYAPYALREGSWDDARRAALSERVLASVERAAPGFNQHVRGVRALAPADLEAACGFPQGQPYHAEIALDQVLWMRPVPELARYRTPIRGLYLCGPAMHPGGNIIGAAGANAASVILRDVKNRKIR
jgi:phytoene dehydrogenase-like protein